jgi:hypothetical protein
MRDRGTPERAARAFCVGAIDALAPVVQFSDFDYAGCKSTDDRGTRFSAKFYRLQNDNFLATLDRCIALNAARLDAEICKMEAE